MDSLAFYFPLLAGRGPRGVLITLTVVIITLINVRGIRLSAWFINVLTVGKIVPLLAYAALGCFFLDASRLAPGEVPSFSSVTSATVLLIFAFGGYEVVPVTGGETRDPRRAIPFAMVMTIVFVTVLMTAAQVVALGTLPDLARSRTALADSAVVFLGGAGALLITIAAVFAMSGNNFGQSVSGSRNLFALGEHGDIPRVFGWVHPRHRTPVVAIVTTSSVALALALSGTFTTLAIGSAITRLFVYMVTCAATLVLRRPRYASTVNPARFVVPGGPLVPAAGSLLSIAIVAFATPRQISVGAAALLAGAALYLMTRVAAKHGPGERENFLEEA
jgi:amino acid transporter